MSNSNTAAACPNPENKACTVKAPWLRFYDTVPATMQYSDKTMAEAVFEMAEKYPEYRFDQHKGYPTKLHYEMLDRYGPSPIHRMSFLKKWEAGK